MVFYKPLRTVAGPGDAIVLPRAAKGEKNDYETELVSAPGPRPARYTLADIAVTEITDYCYRARVQGRLTRVGAGLRARILRRQRCAHQSRLLLLSHLLTESCTTGLVAWTDGKGPAMGCGQEL